MRTATAPLLLLLLLTAGCLRSRYDCDVCVPGSDSTCVAGSDRRDPASAQQQALNMACMSLDERCNGRLTPSADEVKICAALPAKAPPRPTSDSDPWPGWYKACWSHPELWQISCRKVRYVPWPFPG
jgi:hypothetical protein